jgi:hypothetical protein
MRPLVNVGLAAFVLLTGCGQPPQPAPAPRPTEDAALRPLTSRDEPAGGVRPTADPHAGHDHGAASDPHAEANPHGEAGGLPSGHPPVDGSHASGGAAAPVDPKASISGTVDVAPAMKARIQGGALFLIARSAKTRQILAVRKADGVAFPQKFALSGADAMTPGTPFEGPLDVTARWSQNGDAMPAPGDIEGVTKGVAVGAANVKLVLAEARK